MKYGFHFCRYASSIFTPVIRKEIREAKISNRGHYTVYLPSYSDEKLFKFFRPFKNTRWQIFSKHNKQVILDQNIEIYPISVDGFTESLISSEGVISGAGFETPAEALYLGKKLLVIPMKGQYEQQYNAESLNSMGITVLKNLKERQVERVEDWISSDYKIEITYPNQTEKIILHIQGKKNIIISTILELVKVVYQDGVLNMFLQTKKKNY